MDEKLSFKKVLKNDYLFGLAVIFAVVCAAFECFYLFPRGYWNILMSDIPFESKISQNECVFCAVLLLVVIVALCASVRRYSYLKSFESETVKVKGKVNDFSRYKDRIYIKVSYSYGSEDFNVRMAFFRNKETKTLSELPEVELCLKETNPSKPLIIDFYF